MGRDGVAGLVVLAASLFLFWATLGLQKHPLVPVGPEFYPRLVLGVTAAMAALLVAIDLVAQRKRRLAGAIAAPDGPRNYALVAVSFAIFAGYALSLPWIGFRVATLLFLLAMPAVLERPRGARRWLTIGVVAVVGTLVTYYVFDGYLHVLLPRGRWTGF